MRLFMSVITGLYCVSALAAQENKYRPAIDKGLAWLAKKQNKDGGWSDTGGGFPTATNALAAMALLADGHTVSEGKYAAHQRRALQWFLSRKLKNAKHLGLLGSDPNDPDNTARYMPQHGVAMSYLAKLYGEIEDPVLRRAVGDRLRDAVSFSVKGQSTLGGWFYSSTCEGHDSTENGATVVVLQGLIDARDAGIAVPKETLARARKYLERCTTKNGGIVYSGGQPGQPTPIGGGRPTFTAMALAAYLPAHGQMDKTIQRWIQFCGSATILSADGFKRHRDLLPHYYLTKVVFHLDEKEMRTLFPDKKTPDHLIWVKCRAVLFDFLQQEQSKDGSWSGDWGSPRNVMNTSFALHILLYENSVPFRLSR